MNSNYRIATTLHSLETWFISGVGTISANTPRKGDDDDDDDDDDDTL
jgi:hypothetical protein